MDNGEEVNGEFYATQAMLYRRAKLAADAEILKQCSTAVGR